MSPGSMPRLREFREQRFMTQAELAMKASVTVATISRLETGKRRPQFGTVKKLAGALGVEPRSLSEKGER